MARANQAKRACDRCHSVKEKCRWIGSDEPCERCHRLRFNCHTNRPLAAAGRKPRHHTLKALVRSRPGSPSSGQFSSPTTSNSDVQAPPSYLVKREESNIPENVSLFIHLAASERDLLDSILQGRTRVDQFLVGPSFLERHQKTFLKHLGMATTLLVEPLIASSALIACENDALQGAQNRQIGHKRAASAVSALRSLSLFNAQDVPIVLILGSIMVTFALHITGTAFSICRHSLNLVKPFYDSTELDSDGLAFLLCLLHSETFECLLRCELPTLRFRAPEQDGIVDRFLGVAFSLLPHMHDICELGHLLRRSEAAKRLEIMPALGRIQAMVNLWEPALPADFTVNFTPAEVVSLLTQAKVHRWSTLLICHRLRYPYGTETYRGIELAHAILEELDLTIRLAKRSIPCVEIAFMVACFELTDREKRKAVLSKTETVIEFSKQLQSRIRTLITVFWNVRDSEDQLYWFQLADLFPL